MKIDLRSELEVRTSRSGGKGGQHVNKVETRVEVRFDIMASRLLSLEQKDVLLHKLAKRLSSDHVLSVVCHETRSQLSNKEIAIGKLHHLLEQCLIKRKARIATKVPHKVKENRLKGKKCRADVKVMRRRVGMDE